MTYAPVSSTPVVSRCATARSPLSLAIPQELLNLCRRGLQPELELGVDQKHRRELLAELALKPLPGDDRVDGDEYLDILGEAVAVRNGWKRILSRCSTDIDESVQ